jgi:hypothetical protein
MNAEITLFGKHISMASRARRRALVVFLYVAFAAWIVGFVCGLRYSFFVLCFLYTIALFLFAGYAGTGAEGGDEREVHRRDHAYFVAHKQMGWLLIAALFAFSLQGLNNSIPQLFPSAYRGILEALPFGVLMALITVNATLPAAILLWTEPDMEDRQS